MPNINISAATPIQAELPRVTDILKEAGLIDTQWLTEHGRERGTAVHLACQYHDEGTLDYSSIDPEIEGYVRSYDAWKRDSRIGKFDWIECPLQDKLGRYRGTEDRIICVRPRRLIDLKTGAPQDWWSLQLVAYVGMLDDPFSYDRQSLRLFADGKTGQITQYPKSEYQSDLNVFLSFLNIVNWKRGKTNGRKPTT